MTATNQTLLDSYRPQGIVVAIVALVQLLAGVNWILSPDGALRWLRAMLVLPAVWLGMTLWYHHVRRSTRDSGDQTGIRRYFLSALVIGIAFPGAIEIARLGLEIWFRIGDHGASLEVGRRILGLVASAVYIGFGNVLPKILTPLSMLAPHLADRVTRARRVVGRTFVGVGVAAAIGFIWLPLDLAKPLWLWMNLAAMLTILGAIVWMNAGPARVER